MKTLTAVLFAGGESRRMGVDKATLLINGEPLWSRQLRVLREVSPEKIIVSARSRPAWCPPEIGVIQDAVPSRGPLSGLAAGLAAIKTSHALVLAMDLPLMETGCLRRLWAQCGEKHGVVPADGNSFEPLCAIYPAGAAEAVSAALIGENHSLHHVIDLLLARSLMRALPVSPDERRAFLNLNTPADLAVLPQDTQNSGRQDA